MRDIQSGRRMKRRSAEALCHIACLLCQLLTFDPTVARLQYSLALVLMLLGSIVRASE